MTASSYRPREQWTVCQRRCCPSITDVCGHTRQWCGWISGFLISEAGGRTAACVREGEIHRTRSVIHSLSLSLTHTHTHTLRPVMAPVETDPADRLLMDICHKCLAPVVLMRRRLACIVDARPLSPLNSHKQSKLTRNDAKSTRLSGKSPVWSDTQSIRKDGSAEIRVSSSEPGPILKLALISLWTT